MRYFYTKILFFLSALISVEELAIYYLPVPDGFKLQLRFLSEILIYFLFIGAVVRKILYRGGYKKNMYVGPYMLLFILSGLVSMYLNNSEFLPGIVGIRAICRYMALYYAIVVFGVSEENIKKIIKITLFMGVIQCITGLLQVITHGDINNYLILKNMGYEFGDIQRSFVILDRGREKGSIFGLATDTVLYGYFILICLCIIVAKVLSNMDSRKKNIFLAAIMIFCIFKTYVRACTILSMFLVTSCLWKMWGARLIPVALATIFSILFLFNLILPEIGYVTFYSARDEEVGVFKDLTTIFTPEYIEAAKYQRLGAILGNIPTVLANKPFFGYGPDLSNAVWLFNNEQLSFSTRDEWRETMFKDVYWVAILCLYGAIGLGVISAIFIKFIKIKNLLGKLSNNPIDVYLSNLMHLMIPMVILSTSFQQTLEFRMFSFYFWLFSGIMVHRWNVFLSNNPSAALNKSAW